MADAVVVVDLAVDLATETHHVRGDLRTIVSQVAIALATVGITKLRKPSQGAGVLSGDAAPTMASFVATGTKHLQGTEQTKCSLSSRVNPLYFEEHVPVLL